MSAPRRFSPTSAPRSCRCRSMRTRSRSLAERSPYGAFGRAGRHCTDPLTGPARGGRFSNRRDQRCRIRSSEPAASPSEAFSARGFEDCAGRKTGEGPCRHGLRRAAPARRRFRGHLRLRYARSGGYRPEMRVVDVCPAAATTHFGLTSPSGANRLRAGLIGTVSPQFRIGIFVYSRGNYSEKDHLGVWSRWVYR